MGYYIQGDYKIDIKYNSSAQKKSYNNNKNNAFDNMPNIQHLISIKNMPYIEKNRPPLPIIDKNMTSKEHMPAKNQKSPKLPAYETEEEFILGPNFRKYVEEYQCRPFL